MVPAAQVVLIRSGACLRPDEALPLLAAEQTSSHACRDVLGDLVLHREHVGHRSIESLGPVLVSRGDIDELNGHAQALVRLSHAAVEERGDVKVPRDLAHVAAGLPEVKRCGSRGHAQAGDVRQRGDQLLGDTLAQVFLIARGAHVDEGQNGDRGDRRCRRRGVSGLPRGRRRERRHESVPTTMPRLDEPRLFRVVHQRPPQLLYA